MTSNVPQSCVETDGFLVELAYGEESAVPASVREHLDTCERCQQELRALQEVRAAAGTVPLEEPSDRMDAAVMAALDAHLADESPAPEISAPPRVTLVRTNPGRKPQRSRRWVWSSMAAAASVILVGGGTWLLNEGDKSASPAERTVVEQTKGNQQAPIAAKSLQGFGARNEQTGTPQPSDVPGSRPAKEWPAKHLTRHPSHEALKKSGEDRVVDGLLGSGGDAPTGGIGFASGAPVDVPAPPRRVRAPMAHVSQHLSSESHATLTPKTVAGPAPRPATLPAAPARALDFADQSSSNRASALPPPPPALAATPMDEDAAPMSRREEPRGHAADKEKATAWQADLSDGEDALNHGRYGTADAYFRRLLLTPSVPDWAVQKALEGRLRAATALHQRKESERIQAELNNRFPGSPYAQSPAAAQPAAAAPAPPRP